MKIQLSLTGYAAASSAQQNSVSEALPNGEVL